MALTAAQRQKKYREKLKKENPDKYEEYKKKTAERAKLYYREKASQYTDEEKEKRRQQWRDDRERNCAAKKQRRLTPAERQKRFREKLKLEDPDKYEEYKKKTAERAKLYYREKASQYTEEEKEKRRQQRRARELSSAEAKKNCKKSKIENSDEYGEIKENVENYKCYKEKKTRNEVIKQIRKKLTPAERQRRYRDKLKRENTEKYLEIKKKVAEKARQCYREKATLSTDAHENRQWNGREKRVSSGERVKRYRERLRRENPTKYAELMKKSAENSKHYYREKAKLYTEEEKEKRRQLGREDRRINKMRKQKRRKHELVDNQKNSDEESWSEQEAQPGPSEIPITPPWHNPASPSVSDHSQPQDPLRRLIDQCRFCGEFSKDCVVVSSHTPYLAGDKTTIAFNHISVQLDFNEDLPNTVCKYCDNKLNQFSEFIKLVKNAQDSINGKIKEEDVRETEVFIKTEVPEDDGNSVSIGDTVFVKKTTNKRKSDDVNKYKAKVTKPNVVVECNDVLVDIKQEIDDDIQIESSRHSDESSETLSIPEEMKREYDFETVDTFSVSEVIKKEVNRK